MRSLRYNDTARAHLVAITTYIRERSGSSETARSFGQALRAQCRKIASLTATIGRARSDLEPDLRSFAFGNYLILFRYHEDFVEIVGIIEGHRDVAALFDDNGSD